MKKKVKHAGKIVKHAGKIQEILAKMMIRQDARKFLMKLFDFRNLILGTKCYLLHSPVDCG
jgi:hypothetical protein